MYQKKEEKIFFVDMGQNIKSKKQPKKGKKKNKPERKRGKKKNKIDRKKGEKRVRSTVVRSSIHF